MGCDNSEVRVQSLLLWRKFVLSLSVSNRVVPLWLCGHLRATQGKVVLSSVHYQKEREQKVSQYMMV